MTVFWQTKCVDICSVVELYLLHTCVCVIYHLSVVTLWGIWLHSDSWIQAIEHIQIILMILSSSILLLSYTSVFLFVCVCLVVSLEFIVYFFFVTPF